MARRWHTLSVTLAAGDEPPREVRLFRRGKNTSTKGTVIFDDDAARAVLAAAQEHGVDVMIDLEHLALDTESRAFDPDARGWGRLAVRDGELWLVDIKWTTDGDARLRSKRQRYVSPAFNIDDEGRVVRVLNVAITALPATDHAMPLIAARILTRSQGMDPKLIMEALDALEGGDSAKALEILKALIASAAGAADVEAPAEEAPAEMAEGDEEKEDEMIAAAARKLTGHVKGSTVVAALRGIGESRTAAQTAGVELATLRQQVLGMQLREMIRSNPRRVATPKLEALLLSSKTIEAAQALVDALPDVVAAPVSQPAKPATSEVKLTEEDREVCKLTGTPVAKLLDFKRAQSAR